VQKQVDKMLLEQKLLKELIQDQIKIEQKILRQMLHEQMQLKNVVRTNVVGTKVDRIVADRTKVSI
jgi:hypothetical protein